MKNKNIRRYILEIGCVICTEICAAEFDKDTSSFSCNLETSMGTEIVTITFPTPQRYVVDLWIGIVTWCQLRNIPITTGCIECFFNEDSVFNTPYESVPIVDLAASQRYVIKIKE